MKSPTKSVSVNETTIYISVHRRSKHDKVPSLRAQAGEGVIRIHLFRVPVPRCSYYLRPVFDVYTSGVERNGMVNHEGPFRMYNNEVGILLMGHLLTRKLNFAHTMLLAQCV